MFDDEKRGRWRRRKWFFDTTARARRCAPLERAQQSASQEDDHLSMEIIRGIVGEVESFNGLQRKRI